MGYDLYWADEPPEELAVPYAKAEEAFQKAVEARDEFVKNGLGMSYGEARSIQYRAVEVTRSKPSVLVQTQTLDPPTPEEEERARQFWIDEKELREGDEYKALQEAVDKNYEGLDKARKWYFRANIWGMQQLREWMEQSGMIDWEARSAEFPEPDDFKVPRQKVAGTGITDWDEESPEWAKYEEAQEETLKAVDGPINGIAGFKLSDNSGWWITPDEIKIAVALHETYKAAGKYDWTFYDHAGREFQKFLKKSGSELAKTNKPEEPKTDPEVLSENERWFEEWVEFLRQAADHGGVRVY